MYSKEKDLSKYIDSLNAERKPKAHGQQQACSAELEELYKAVRVVRRLKEPAMPGDDYPQKLVRAVTGQLSNKISDKKRRRLWLVCAAVSAAVLAVVITLNFVLPLGNNNFVYAMEQAFKNVSAYHGYLEYVVTNAEGNSTTQAKLEVWADKEGRYYVRNLEGAQKGLITVNNAQKKWQVRPGSKEVYVFPAFPDPYRFVFELGKEIEGAKNALETKTVGEETIAGRNAVIVEVLPQGGLPYRIWIDKETKLPLQKQSAMQNALQYTVSYTAFELADSLPEELLNYDVPAGFTEINTRPELAVTGLQEAFELAGFVPRIPQFMPEGYREESIAVETDTGIVKLNFSSVEDSNKKVVVLEKEAVNGFKPAAAAILGRIGSSTAEIQAPLQSGSGILGGSSPYEGITGINSIRWQDDSIEYAVVGNAPVEELVLFVKGITGETVEIPQSEEQSPAGPQVEVPVNMEVEENEQKSVDAGHSPWKLDPVFVAQVFVSLEMSPNGIEGDYPVKYEDLEMVQNNGTDAVIEVRTDDAPINRVYLKRLVRQDSTGIWTVVGYDPATSY